ARGEQRMPGQRARGVDLAACDPGRIRGGVLAHEETASLPLSQHVAVDCPLEEAVAQPRRQAAVEQLGLQRRERQPAKEAILWRRIPPQDGRAQRRVVSAAAEALRTV